MEGAVLIVQSIGIIKSIEHVPDIIDSIVKGTEKYLKNAFSLIK